eukprot:TRINITY_DN361_c0_g1_i5.p1 TRINITY_DN361_c0_g1~~TRINITY_DN361_c0_g1_i5.p1  ORF type:complete len:313 (+),score=18.51 TRINITY_DN361_c0_g1_i5:137-1075(+)
MPLTYVRYALAGSLCVASAHMILVPIDVVKTRMQLDKGRYSGLLNGFKVMLQQEGASSLRRGFRPTVAGYLLQGAAKFGFFELFKARCTKLVGEMRASEYSMVIYLVSSATAEILGSFLLCPFEALRIRKVGQPAFPREIIAGFKNVVQQEGVGGLYRGLSPLLLKQLPYTIVQLTAFTYFVDKVYRYLETRNIRKNNLNHAQQLSISVACGMGAGVLSSLASQPGDTILSRINMAAKTGQGRRSVSSVYSEIGFRGLWLGTGARCVFTGLLSAAIFLVYDSTKVLVGLPTSSGIKKDNLRVADPEGDSEVL